MTVFKYMYLRYLIVLVLVGLVLVLKYIVKSHVLIVVLDCTYVLKYLMIQYSTCTVLVLKYIVRSPVLVPNWVFTVQSLQMMHLTYTRVFHPE